MKLANIETLFEKKKKVVTVKELADAVRCSETYILELIHSDSLPCFIVGSQYRLIVSDVLSCFVNMALVYAPADDTKTD